MWSTRRNRKRPTFGGGTAEISSLLGKPLFPWQKHVVDVAREVDPDTGELWYETVIVFVQRRSGKTTLVPPLVAQECGRPERSQAWLTAQKRDNAVKRWREATEPLLPLLSPSTAKRKISHSFEEMRWLQSDSLFRPFAPDEEGMHGEDPDLVFVDEFWALGLQEFHTIREGYAAAWSVKSGQEWLMSAAGTHRSTAMKDARRRGRAATFDPESRTAYFEWCIPDEIGGVPAAKVENDDLLPVIMEHHPRAGFGLKPEFVLGELQKNKTGALRAYGGLDSDTSEQSMPISDTAFRRSLDRHRRIPKTVRVAFGLASDGDLRQAAISAAWKDPKDGRVLTEVIEVRDQVRWATGAMVDLLGSWPDSVAFVRADTAGRDLADDVEQELRARGVDSACLKRVSQSDYAAASHRLRSGLETNPEPVVLHLGERALREALQNAGVERGIWMPARGPIAVLQAHTLAAWGSDRLPAVAEPEPAFRVL